MVWILAAIVIGSMAGRTLGRGTSIPGSMTGNAISRKMRPCQRETRRIVIKHIVGIASRVTGQASRIGVGITNHPVVTVVCGWIGMATDACKLSIIRRVGMAICTSIPFPLVFAAVNREILGIVVESCRRPGCFRMTGFAIG